MKYIDIHGHPNFAAYDQDRGAVLDRARAAGVGMIAVGTDLETSKSAVALAEANADVWATIGMHPVFAGESHNDPQETGNNDKSLRRPKQNFDRAAFLTLARHPKVVAIGECGLDLFHSRPDDVAEQRKVEQRKVFEEHISVANECGKPLMLHVRNAVSLEPGQPSAYIQAVEILERSAKVKANFHFFAGTTEDLDAILAIGGTVSFTGVLTFTRDYDDIVKACPIESMMSETDCPYVAPLPYRGKRNEPVYVVEVVKAIARIKGIDEKECAAMLLENTKRIFGV